jgi:hypothetical protein
LTILPLNLMDQLCLALSPFTLLPNKIIHIHE